MQQKGKCLALGAGAIGKSVSGYIFTQLGFDFRYAEIDDAVISDINRRGGYDLYTAVSGDQIKKQEIRGICAARVEDAQTAEFAAEADFIVTAVGAANLAAAAASIAGWVRRRSGQKRLAILLFENGSGLRELVEGELRRQLGSLPAWLSVSHASIERISKKVVREDGSIDGVSAVSYTHLDVYKRQGQNGSGKTTLVKHLNGLYKPTDGDVRYNGQSVLKKTVAQISRNIILVFQHPERMLFEQSVTQEITFCARMQQVPFTDEQVSEVLEKYGLSEDAETFPINLSMGKKHLLTILSVLFSSADVVILDEPTLGMDLHIKQQLEEIIAFLKEQGKTVIMISHEIPLVFKVADAAVILSGGKKVYEGGKEALARRQDIFDAININLPPVVRLSKRYGFSKVCYNVAEFAREAARMLAEKEA